MIRLGILISGRGSNMRAILDAVREKRLPAEVAVVLGEQGAAGVAEARRRGVPAFHISRKEMTRKQFEALLACFLDDHEADLVVLAGFMRILSSRFLSEFPGRVVNIHPSLLPAFPGKDAQKQALEHGVKVAGCTVHFVDEGVDTGPIIAQATVPVFQGDDEDSLKARILKAEHKLYPYALGLLATKKVLKDGRRVLLEER